MPLPFSKPGCLTPCIPSCLISAILLLSPVHPVPAAGTTSNAPPVVFFDATPLLNLDLNDPAQRRQFFDTTHLLVSLQGLANRDAPRLFLRYVREPDDFWWEQMTREGGWLSGRSILHETSLETLLARFTEAYNGAVVWDERVPATSNLASSIAGCDDLLCLRYDPLPGSLYRRLTEASPHLAVRVRLLGEGETPLFTGRGSIPGTELPSTGSPKCDAYRWLIEHYLNTGKANPRRLGYYLDAYWLQRWQISSPVNHTLSNHDYVIAHRGIIFDLNVWEDEACVDDPEQQPGTDRTTLKALLRSAYDRLDGRSMMHVAGFVPWAFKYTNHPGAGGRHEPVPTEWHYAAILSCYNAYLDADALGLGAMANASFFQHYPLKPHYAQPHKPTRESLQARGLLDPQGHVVPGRYVAHYVGDYDAAAWLYQQLPRMWRDSARGTTPLSWAFNPNLADRFPLGMAWAREHSTTNDYFVAGDSGAGYLNPGLLAGDRVHSGLPSGLAAWEDHCTSFYRQWDLSLTGFIIDGDGPPMSEEVLDAYARFSPDGIVAQKVPLQSLHKDMPVVRMRTDLPPDPLRAARALVSLTRGTQPRFAVARSILQPPSWYAAVEREVNRIAPGEHKIVDLYTLMSLVRYHEQNPAPTAATRWNHVLQVTATPHHEDDLAPVYLEDGPFARSTRDNVPTWQLPHHQPPHYLYLDVADAFAATGSGRWEILLDYWDGGDVDLRLQYDSTDTSAPHGGAYKTHPFQPERLRQAQWRTARFRINDARFRGSQNGAADFRVLSTNADLIVSSVRVRKLP